MPQSDDASSHDHSQHVREVLRELHDVLGQGDPLESDLETPLREALHEVQQALDRAHERSEASEHEGLVGKMEALAVEFETAHPMLAGLINRLTHQLASLGI